MREKLYATRIAKRKITILDVPVEYRDAVMALLSDSDRERMERLIAPIPEPETDSETLPVDDGTNAQAPEETPSESTTEGEGA